MFVVMHVVVAENQPQAGSELRGTTLPRAIIARLGVVCEFIPLNKQINSTITSDSQLALIMNVVVSDLYAATDSG